MPTSPAIRLAELNDSQNLAELCGELGYPTRLEDAARRLKDILVNPVNEALLAAVVEDQVVGWVHVLRVNFLGSEAFAEIGGLVVHPAYRGRGVGKALMSAAEDWAHRAGLSAVKLRSNTLRTEAHIFYENLGYQRIKSQFTFHKDLKA